MTAAIRIIYVDDEPDLLDIGKLFLEESEAFTVTTALSAQEGIRLLEQEKFDAIISDYQMPGMDGIQFLVEVRERFGPIPFILFTGRGREEIVIQAINSGVDFYLQKGGEPGAQFAELSHKIKQAVSSKKAGDALRESEKRFRLLVQNSNDIIQIMDRNGVPFYISDQLLRILGYRPEDRIGRTCLSDIHPDDFPAVQDLLCDIIEHPGTTGKIEYRYRHKNGNWVDLEGIGCSMLDDPEIHGIFLNIRDITDKKREDKEREFKNALLSTQQETTLDAILVVDENGKILNYNQKFIEIWGIPEEHLASRMDEPLLQFVVGQLADPEAFLSRVRYLYEHKTEKSFEEILLKDGRILERFSAPLRGERGTYYGRVWSFRDITERKKAEESVRASHDQLIRSEADLRTHMIELETQAEELRKSHLAFEESRDKFLDLYDFAPLGYLTLNDKACIMGVNLTGAKLLGIERSKLLKAPFSKFVAEKDADPWHWYFLNVLNQEEKRICTLMLTQRDGSAFPARLEGIRITDSDGTNTVRITFTDISDITHVEETLRDSEEKFRSLTESSPDYIMRYDRQCRHTYMNPAALRVSGLTEGQIIGKTHRESGFDETQSRFWEDKITNVFETGKPCQTQFAWDSPGGRVFLDWMLTPEFSDDGKVQSVLGVSRDITRLKNAEEAMRQKEALLKRTGEIARVGGWEMDAETLVVTWTEETYHLHEVPVGQMPLLEAAIHFFHPEDQGKLSDAITRALTTGEGYDMELRFITATGKHLWTRTVCQPQVVDGKTIRLNGTFQDITDRKLAEEELLKKNE